VGEKRDGFGPERGIKGDLGVGTALQKKKEKAARKEGPKPKRGEPPRDTQYKLWGGGFKQRKAQKKKVVDPSNCNGKWGTIKPRGEGKCENNAKESISNVEQAGPQGGIRKKGRMV